MVVANMDSNGHEVDGDGVDSDVIVIERADCCSAFRGWFGFRSLFSVQATGRGDGQSEGR
jgi:hypothetical protein